MMIMYTVGKATPVGEGEAMPVGEGEAMPIGEEKAMPVVERKTMPVGEGKATPVQEEGGRKGVRYLSHTIECPFSPLMAKSC